MPVFDMIETVLVKKLRFKPTWYLRFISRNIYVALTMFVGITFPFFGGLLGFFGGFAFAPTTYFVSKHHYLMYVYSDTWMTLSNTKLFPQLPCIMWLAIYKPRKFSLSWCANWVSLI